MCAIRVLKAPGALRADRAPRGFQLHEEVPFPWSSKREEGELCSSSFLLFFFKYFLYFVYVDPKTHWSLPQMPLGTARHKAQKGGDLWFIFHMLHFLYMGYS